VAAIVFGAPLIAVPFRDIHAMPGVHVQRDRRIILRKVVAAPISIPSAVSRMPFRASMLFKSIKASGLFARSFNHP
jgi:hypothetical protein